MSYILEAIKKAESERGNTRLYENHHADNTPQVTKPIPWVAIAIFINAVILLAWIGMQKFSDSGISNNQYEEKMIESNSQPLIEMALPLESKVITKEIHQVDELQIKELESPNNDLETKELFEESTNNKPNFLNRPANAEITNNKLIDIEKAPAKQQKIMSAKVESLPITNILESDEEDDEIVMGDSSEAELPIEALEIAKVAKEIPIIENPNVPSLNELPYSLQQRIPDLTISVHIYNALKNARKVRVNGKLLHQGDAVSDDLSIQEITSYGVIFNYSGELFKVTLR